MPKRKKLLIGRFDLADFPELDLEQIEVKIDTGAYTASFHCHDIDVIEVDGTKKLRCYFLDPAHEQYHHKEFTFDRFSKKRVRSSNGMLEERFAVETTMRLFGKSYPLELTLTERGSMKFPVLLGRKFLTGRFIVDCTQSRLSARDKRVQVELIRPKK